MAATRYKDHDNVVANLKVRRSTNARRNLVVLRLACCCGMRVSEIAQLVVRPRGIHVSAHDDGADEVTNERGQPPPTAWRGVERDSWRSRVFEPHSHKRDRPDRRARGAPKLQGDADERE